MSPRPPSLLRSILNRTDPKGKALFSDLSQTQWLQQVPRVDAERMRCEDVSSLPAADGAVASGLVSEFLGACANGAGGALAASANVHDTAKFVERYVEPLVPLNPMQR